MGSCPGFPPVVKIEVVRISEEEDSISGSWGNQRHKIGNTPGLITMDCGRLHQACGLCDKEHMEIKEGLVIIQRCIH